MMQRIVQVDAFTDRPFTGNPAAVCVLRDLPSEAWMQDVAREMNLSETAFLIGHEDGYDLRWFTPTVEVELCGHATLASAHVLWEDEYLPRGEEARFHTHSGLLRATRRDDGWIDMDFPAEPPEEVEPPEELIRALGVTPKYVGRNRFDYLVLVDAETTVRTLTPNFNLLRLVDTRGVIVTSRAIADRFHFVSRFFAPAVGVDEDPVTGSAHCCLAPFWAERLGMYEMTGYQVSPRGGIVRVRTEEDRVVLGGQAVTVLRGEMV